MQRYILIRMAQAVFALWAITLIVFALSHASGDPLAVMMPIRASEEEVARVRRYYGLDKPLHVQYWKFISRAVQGDFGKSIHPPHGDAMGLVFSRMPATLQLMVPAFFIAIFVGVPLGVMAAVRRDSPFDYQVKLLALLGQSAPDFWIALMLMWVLSVQFGWLPTSGRGGLDHMIMPVITIVWGTLAGMMRIIRSAMLDVLDSEYIKLARLKGVPEWRVIWLHGLRNAGMIPLTMFGLMALGFIGGSVIIETVFAWPGVGQLGVAAAQNRDFQVLQAVVIFFSSILIVGNLVVDILYGYMDPRVRIAN